MSWYSRFWRGDRKEVEQTGRVVVAVDLPPMPIAVLPPNVSEEIRCFVKAVHANPGRFRLISPWNTVPLHGTPVYTLIDRELNRRWDFKYRHRPGREHPELNAADISLSHDEKRYLVTHLKPVFQQRAALLRQWQEVRRQRKERALREELHAMYCTGGKCDTSCT